MSGNLWISFVGAKAAISLTPGPAVMLVLAQGLLPGGRSLAAAAGVLLVNGLFFILAALGLGALFSASPEVFLAIKWVASAYLVYAGVRVFLGKSSVLAPEAAPARSGGRTIWTGALLQLGNPNALVFFGAMLPQFVDPRQEFVPQICTLGATGLILDLLVLAAYGAFAARLSAVASAPRFRVLTNRIAGCLLMATGVVAAVLR